MSWPMFRRVERQARRMHEMMERINVDPRVLTRLRGGDAYAQARATCLFCGSCDKCLRWLDDPAKSGTRPEFCPNLSLFEACRRKSPPADTGKPAGVDYPYT